MSSNQILFSSKALVEELRSYIEQVRENIARSFNGEMVLLYWRIGKRIKAEVLHEERAEYGKRVVEELAKQLTADYGKGFGAKSLLHMVRFAEIFADERIVSTLSRQLSWSHFLEIIYLKSDLQRDFYAEMCRVERWSVRCLRAKINGMLFERTAISRKPEETARLELQKLREGDELTPDMVFRDPYLLNFLGLTDTYSEKNLEDAILHEMEQFLMELGAGFSFVGRQYRITVGNEDFFIDLLFYNRLLRRLVAIELKLGKFRAEHKGQMELYLRWLDKNERQEDELPPIGLILCSDSDQEQIELLELEQSGIRVAEYYTQLPPREVLARQLHKAIEIARGRCANEAPLECP